MVVVKSITPCDPQARCLIHQLDQYQLSIYPEESNHLDSEQELSQANVYLVGALESEKMIGIGAIKFLSNDGEYGEIKRVYVSPDGRGKGVAHKIMQDLQTRARLEGVKVLRLETGIYQPEAIGLYQKLGFYKREKFGDYTDDPYSVFMEKVLT